MLKPTPKPPTPHTPGPAPEVDLNVLLRLRPLLAAIRWLANCPTCGGEKPHQASHDCAIGLIARCEGCGHFLIEAITPHTFPSPDEATDRPN